MRLRDENAVHGRTGGQFHFAILIAHEPFAKSNSRVEVRPPRERSTIRLALAICRFGRWQFRRGIGTAAAFAILRARAEPRVEDRKAEHGRHT